MIRSIYFVHSVSFRSSTHRDIRTEILRSFKHAFIQVVGHPDFLCCTRKRDVFSACIKEIGDVRTQAKTVSHFLNAR